VLLDLGVDVPSPVAAINASYRSVSKNAPTNKKLDPADELAKMLKADKELMAASSSSTLTAWSAWLDENARIHRPGAMPIVGKEAVTAWLAGQKYPYSGEPMFSDIAISGDLGYTYGKAELNSNGQNGYYARVWKRDGKGAWKMVVDIFSALPLPPAKSEE
jgi:ketosteroid isomerase-like protein